MKKLIKKSERELKINPGHNRILTNKEVTVRNFAEYELSKGTLLYNSGKYDEAYRVF